MLAENNLRESLQSGLGDAYVVGEELGGGGMSHVFAAQERALNRKVAVKVLAPELAAGINIERFRREIQLAASLQHPNIVALLTAGQCGELLYFTMPLFEGESLKAKLTREGALPVSEVLRVTMGVLSALAYAHKRGVVHRDIKPGNVLVSEHHAVVTDFGVAKALSTATSDSITSSDIALGTPAYMAPEQAAADPQTDHRADIYSVGVLAYEMLTGRPVFAGLSPQATLAAHVSQTPEFVANLRPSVPPALAGMIMRCLEKHPSDRWQSANELLQQLRAFLGSTTDGSRLATPSNGSFYGTPVVTAPSDRVAPRRRIRPLHAVGAVAVLALLVLAVVAPPWRREVTVAGTLSDQGQPSVAVLPFDNLGGRLEDEYFSEGITGEIIGQLAQVEGLKVISRTSVVTLKGRNLTLPQIADTLGVRHVLEGTVRRAGDRIRVNALLIEARTDAHLWAGSYDRSLADVFSVQDEIAREVSARLMRTDSIRPESSASRTGHTAAYDAYLRGTYWRQRRTSDGLRLAIEAFGEAIKLDSSYAPAFAGLAAARINWLSYRHPDNRDAYTVVAQSRRLADRAVRLDSTLAEGFAARGYASTWGFEEESTALLDLRKALALQPNSGEAHIWNARALALGRQYPEALKEADVAIALDPLAPGLHNGYAATALSARRYAVALREARLARDLEPSLKVPIVSEALALLLLRRPRECLDFNPTAPFPAVKAMCLHSAGSVTEAAELVDSLGGIARGRRAAPDVAGSIAMYYAWIGRATPALDWLERAFTLAPHGVDVRYLHSGVFDSVRADPSFRRGEARILAHARDRLRRAYREEDR